MGRVPLKGYTCLVSFYVIPTTSRQLDITGLMRITLRGSALRYSQGRVLIKPDPPCQDERSCACVRLALRKRSDVSESFRPFEY